MLRASLTCLLAGMYLIIEWMIFKFLPAVSATAPVLILAAIHSVVLNKYFHLPILALLLIILINLRFASIILPIMSINAHISGMISVAIGTPHCFEMEHVEISIFQVNFVQ